MQLLGRTALVLALASAAVTSVHAATFTSHSGFGAIGSLFSCKDGNATGGFATGTVLGSGNITGGCHGFYTVDLDTTAKTITLTAAEVGNYEGNTLDITGITEVAITSLTTVSYAPLFNPNYYGQPATYGGIPAPLTSFTGSSISIAFTTSGQAPGQFTFSDTPGQAVFSYSVAAVPEPAVWALMVAGFGLVGLATRRRSVALTA